MKKNMMIAQSGGPSPAINASLAGAVRRAMASEEIDKVYGALHGLEGMLQRKIVCISDQMKTAKDFQMLVHTPAMALGSCRFKLKKDNVEAYKQVLEILRDYNVGYFFYNGGNDSMDTVNSLSKFFKENGEDIKCIGIPKTIDNDLAVTDHTPGFGSAARFIAASFAEIMIDSSAYPNPSVTVVEVMGRNAGWLTASSVLARAHGWTGPHLIYLPEVNFDMEDYLVRIGELLKKETHVIVAASEGIHYADGSYVSQAASGAVDSFGHKQLGGAAQVLEAAVRDKYDVKTRSVQPSVLQRVGIHLASGTDLREAEGVGSKAVATALKGETDKMVTIERVCNSPYLVRYGTTDLANVANHERKVPLEWICDNGTNVCVEMEEYLRPLFRGEIEIVYEDGLPHFFKVDKTALV